MNFKHFAVSFAVALFCVGAWASQIDTLQQISYFLDQARAAREAADIARGRAADNRGLALNSVSWGSRSDASTFRSRVEDDLREAKNFDQQAADFEAQAEALRRGVSGVQ
jgi:hypothetical protein